MKIYLTGYNGRVGERLVGLGCSPLVCDVTKQEEVEEAIKEARPDVVLHLASISDVDYCEDKAHSEEVIRVNYIGTKFVALACQKYRCGMVFLSTDHIFNGKKGPYREDYPYYRKNILGKNEEPVNFYGLSKISAEMIGHAFLGMKIVRTSYLFDLSRIVTSEIVPYPTFINRSFMYLPHFVKSLKMYLDRFYEMPNILHISGSQTVSWYEFMLAYASIFEHDKSLVNPRTKEAKGYAPRPHKAGLVTKLSAKLGFPQYSYIDGLKQMYKDGQWTSFVKSP